MTWRIVYKGVMIGLLTLIAFVVGLKTTTTPIDGLSLDASKIEIGQTMAFITLALSELVHVFNIRNNKESIFKSNPFNNAKLVLAVIVSATLMISVLFVPALRNIFNITVLPLSKKIDTVIIVIIPWINVVIFKVLKINTMKSY